MSGPTTSIQLNVSDNDSNLEIFPEFIPVREEKIDLAVFIGPVSNCVADQAARFQNAMDCPI